MKLRKLKSKDIARMLEWMHDQQTTEYLNTDFGSKKISDCANFISAAQNENVNLHLAVVDNSDEYMGTVSLKNIDPHRNTAEFAITMHPEAQGKGLASKAMRYVLEDGIHIRHLKGIYWCVDPSNARAVRFYDKNGYKRTTKVPHSIKSTYNNPDMYIWYVYTGI